MVSDTQRYSNLLSPEENEQVVRLLGDRCQVIYLTYFDGLMIGNELVFNLILLFPLYLTASGYVCSSSISDRTSRPWILEKT